MIDLPLQAEVTEANVDDWDLFLFSVTFDDDCPVEQFKFSDADVFLEITDWVCYRPGYVERWVEIDGKVWWIDSLDDNVAYRAVVSKDEVIKLVQQTLLSPQQ